MIRYHLETVDLKHDVFKLYYNKLDDHFMFFRTMVEATFKDLNTEQFEQILKNLYESTQKNQDLSYDLRAKKINHFCVFFVRRFGIPEYILN